MGSGVRAVAVPAFSEPPVVPVDVELAIASHAIARKLCAHFPPGVMPVAYPTVAAAIHELLEQGVIEIGPHLNG